MKKYKISKSKLNEFWNFFGKKKPEELQKIIDDDEVLKKIDDELYRIDQSYIPELRKMRKNDPKLFKKMQDMGLIDKNFK